MVSDEPDIRLGPSKGSFWAAEEVMAIAGRHKHKIRHSPISNQAGHAKRTGRPIQFYTSLVNDFQQ